MTRLRATGPRARSDAVADSSTHSTLDDWSLSMVSHLRAASVSVPDMACAAGGVCVEERVGPVWG